ncbi:MAG: hypothetical protein M0R80_11850 [Proteobacteria bacterium]|jgi:hypothetical protein|nr:hypothetical protein [Pseudomonadota bacterium]
MGANRLFWPQQTMDEWIVEEKVVIDGDVLLIREAKRRYDISQAVYFEADVGDGSDPHKLVGRVKEKAALEKLGAEHYMDSVLIGDSAYKVTPGFTGQPIIEVSSAARGADISGAVMTRAGGASSGENDDRELLARFLLDNL